LGAQPQARAEPCTPDGGEALGLVGDNASGKSTLIKTMSGLHRTRRRPPDRGRSVGCVEKRRPRVPSESSASETTHPRSGTCLQPLRRRHVSVGQEGLRRSARDRQSRPPLWWPGATDGPTVSVAPPPERRRARGAGLSPVGTTELPVINQQTPIGRRTPARTRAALRRGEHRRGSPGRRRAASAPPEV
jgi:energy-coupling factor transporter ATP-binding protein EcfA2